MFRWFGSNTDITEQLNTQRELEESLRNRDEFLSVASHELKTPLTSLVLQTQRLSREIQRADQPLSMARLGDYVQSVERQTSRFRRLIDDMLDLTRIRTGQLGLKTDLVSLDAMVQDLVERLRPVLAAARMQVKIDVREAVNGRWDRFRLEQVLSNLLTNAARYSEGTLLEIRIERRGGRARVSVRDQGRGLRAEDRERIFGRFERAVSRDEVSGLGLGLFISRFIVEAHGGRLWAESPGPGLGSTFILELPIEAQIEVGGPSLIG